MAEETKKTTKQEKAKDKKTSAKTSRKKKSSSDTEEKKTRKKSTSSKTTGKSTSSKAEKKTSRSTTKKKTTSAGTGSKKKTTKTSGRRAKKTAPKDEIQQELVFDDQGNVAAEPASNETVLVVPVEIVSEEVSEDVPPEEAPAASEEQTHEEETAAFDESDSSSEEPSPESENDEEIEDETEEQTSEEDAASYRKTRIVSRICGLLFVAVLVICFALNILIPDKQYSDQENRVFQQMPVFSVGNYLSGRFESQLDNYANDQFMFRNSFIKIKSAADLTIGQLKANNVFKCKDSYLMEDITYPDKKSTDADIRALQKFKKKYSAKKMYFMLVPNAANILSDKLPGGVVTHDQNRDMDRLFGAVEALGYKTIDVRDELKKASKTQQVYYRTDHHWTTDGAYIGYKKAAEVMKLKSDIKYKPYVVKNDFVGTLYSKSGFTNGKNDPITIYLPDDSKALNSVIRYADTKEKTTNYYDMENLDKKDAYTVFGGTNHSLFSISTPVKKNRDLLVVKDSYANCFIPFLTQDYRTITVVDPRYYYENIATVIKANDIDEVLFLYNANTFFQDNYMRMMLTNK